ncbi:NADH-quinone oxidoreductase chain m [Nautilia profundicola AmH]|uniref:NADH-quinone oxidoreductase chain m n=1 Tax=Nautilia profundicola (strain ATCC BAA-1463 / DSM 18972 / AmH) TaxID=598659 RepID=B9L619_NAUPA|nr:NADH-quinone oxidoreductase subunit M [Nautilia profundicola]ACM92467.1 NADH-quinone oxidoreductase chain m [Nautilia profundicola AmH]
MVAIDIIFAPIFLSVLLYFLTRNNQDLAKYIALGWFIVQFFIAFSWYNALPQEGFLELGSFLSVPQFGFELTLRVDALSVAMLLLTAALLILVVFTSWEEKNQAAYFSLLVLFSGPIFGVFMTTNVLWFFMFWELTLVPMFFLVGFWGGERRIYAAVKFFLYTHVASMFMFVGFYLLYKQTGYWDLTLIRETALATPALIWWFMFIGFAAKLPAFPFHTWLPDAHVEAPSSISVLLAGVLLKMGAYGLIRFTVELMPITTQEFSIWMLIIGLNTTLFAGMLAIYERHIKKMVAYSSISHMGLVVVAIATMTYDGLSAALYEMIGHALVISPLFLIAGWLHHKTHTWYMDEMGGIMKKAPYVSAIFILAGMAALGLPGTMGFVGELTIIVSAIKSFGWWIAIIAIASLISAGYIIWAVRRSIHGEMSPIVQKAEFTMSFPEKAALAIFALLIVYFGIQPQPIFDLANKAFSFLGGM